jgi:hypothetical protein
MEKKAHHGPVSFLKKEARIVFENSRDTLGILKRFSPLSFCVIILALAFCCVPGALRRDPSLAALLSTAFLLIGGYLPVNIETRYFWPALILVVFSAFVLVSRADRPGVPQLFRDMLLLLACASFVIAPFFQMNLDKSERWEALHRISAKLSSLGVSGRLASESEWESSLYLAFYLRGSYFGVTEPGRSEEELRQELRKYDIDYFLLWSPGPVPAFLRGLPRLSWEVALPDASGETRVLRVYRLR